jgi:Xaa-Pro aminopeptidase
VTHTPIALAWALVPREGQPLLFIDGRKLSNEVRDALAKIADLREPAALEQSLAEFAKGKTVRLDQVPRRKFSPSASKVPAANSTRAAIPSPA